MKRCGVCISPARAEIDETLARGSKSLRTLAKETGLSPWALHRHTEHLAVKLAKAVEAEQAVEANTLLARVESAIRRCERIADAAEEAKDWPPAIAAIRELVKALELLGKVGGELDAAKVRVQVMNQVTINTSGNGLDPDAEIAQLMSKVTDGFSEEKLNYFRHLALGNSRTVEGQGLLTDSTQ